MAPLPPPSPPKKLLIAGPTPRSDANCASSSSTSTTPSLPEKRTRDQPNLSDCHCCGGRINYSNPEDRLQPLDSVWRIVLLCRKCRESVQSGRTCPYCFRETRNSGDLCSCRACERKIHENCVRDYKNCKPWSYSGVRNEGFRVCVDCWVPELWKNSIKVFGRSHKGGLKDKGEGKDLLETVVHEAECGAMKKIKRVSKGKNNVFRRANVEINSVGESDLLAKKDVDSLKGGNSNCSGAVEVVADAELAIHLHRVINSSPRISRGNESLVSSDSLDAIRKWKGLSYKRSGLRKQCSEDQKLGVGANRAESERMNQPAENDSGFVFGRLPKVLQQYKRDRKRKIWQLDNEDTVVLESTSSLQTVLKNMCSDDPGNRRSVKRSGDRFGREVVSYKRTRFRQKVCQVSDKDRSYYDSHRMAFKSDSCPPVDAKLGTGCPVKSDAKVIFPSGICGTMRDRYHLKYVKRISGTKRDSHFNCYNTLLIVNQSAASAVSNSEEGYSVNSGEFIFPNGTCNKENDRYFLKYTKRAKRSKSGSNSETELKSDAFLNKVEISDPGLTMNCSAESRTLSNVSFDSFTIDLAK